MYFVVNKHPTYHRACIVFHVSSKVCADAVGTSRVSLSLVFVLLLFVICLKRVQTFESFYDVDRSQCVLYHVSSRRAVHWYDLGRTTQIHLCSIRFHCVRIPWQCDLSQTTSTDCECVFYNVPRLAALYTSNARNERSGSS